MECPVCHTTFQPKTSTQTFCSRACANRSPQKVFKGSHAPRPRGHVKSTVRDPAWLRQRYEVERMTMAQIAELAGCATPSVHRALRDFGIETIPWGVRYPKRPRVGRPKPRAGLTVAEYEARLEAQHGLCAACGRAESKVQRNGVVRRLAVDHDHATGTIRGLLCDGCNVALGHLGDDPERIRALLAYLTP